ncbi:MAG: phosphoribosylformimino-5-aminoimidazole carboxamide ribotide isomerase [Deltaproteobacteria bacterium]|nr:phosphoribosylformimino-5-aminoimidazole carboxamide ribotide isomerase [Deltaproteobacteria bacterium]
MTQFRPCIDLHRGRVKQIVGATLRDDGTEPATNFVSDRDATWFAQLYRKDRLVGGHIIMLGPGNERAARAALAVWPQGFHIGGGLNAENARFWIDSGAGKVIVTSWLFTDDKLDIGRAAEISAEVGRERLVFDLSCRKAENGWRVVTKRWQTITQTQLDRKTLDLLAKYCGEFLVHATEREGTCRGIEHELVALLGSCSPIPCTYAGGARTISDLEHVEKLSKGKVDLTYGSALDIFGGNLVRYSDCVAWNRGRERESVGSP